MPDKPNMREQILDAASRLVQTRGFHAFSYADIALEVGIRKASIHYYFPSKTDLGTALVARYRETIARKAAQIVSQTPGADEQLQRYAQIFRDILRGAGPDNTGRICLCGTLAAEWQGLPEAVRAQVQLFFVENEAWLAERLEAGRARGALSFHGPSALQASAFLAGLEGALLSARVRQDVTLYCAVAHQLLAQLGIDTLDLYPLDLYPPALNAEMPAQSVPLVLA